MIARALTVALALFLLSVATPPAVADDDSGGGAGGSTPVFASLRSDKVNMRAGPGREYPIRWVYRRDGLPVEIVRSIGNWRLVRDSAGTRGWVHSALLSANRTALVLGDGAGAADDPNRASLVPERPTRLMHERPDPDSPVRARLASGLIVSVTECRIDWCRVRVDGTRGWVRKVELWGVGPREVFR